MGCGPGMDLYWLMSHAQTKLQISFSELNESQMKCIACCHVFRQKFYVRRKNHSNTSRVFVAINNSTNENPRLVCAEWDQTLARTGVTSLQLTCGTRWEATVVTTCWRARYWAWARYVEACVGRRQHKQTVKWMKKETKQANGNGPIGLGHTN
jgi:hypothetical protein